MTIDLIATGLISGVIGATLGYLGSYTKAKGENQALREDVAKITSEKEEVTLESTRRKHHYEKRYELYARYMSLLDEFKANNAGFDTDELSAHFIEMSNRLMANLEDVGEQMKVLNEFGEIFRKMVAKSLSNLKQISAETNELKLVATDEINEYLDRLLVLYEEGNDLSSKAFESLDLAVAQNHFSDVSTELNMLGEQVQDVSDKLYKAMRDDLAKI